MNLITICPACSTRFKLVPDQLKVSEGWVRCGQCMEVFDAQEHLEPEVVAAPQWARIPLLTEELGIAPDTPAVQAQDPQPSGIDSVLPPTPAPAATAPQATITAPDTAFDTATDFDTSAQNASDELPAQSESPKDVGFIKNARRKALWKSPWVRLALAVLATFLSAVLALQVAGTQHDALAAQYPQSRDALDSVCALLGCEIKPHADLDAVVIDSSSFRKLATEPNAEAFALELRLKNKAAYAVAWPSVELSLTNAQDQVVLRKIIAPTPLEASTAMPAQSERSLALPLRVNTAALQSRVSGYRVLLFYP